MKESVIIVEYDVKQRAETVIAEKTFNDTRYGSWKAINIGTAPVTVDGVVLQAGEGLEHRLEPNQKWKEPIVISNIQPGGAIRLLRDINTPHAKRYYVED